MLNTLVCKEYAALLVSHKVKGWFSVQKKPGHKSKGTKSSLEAGLSVYRVGGSCGISQIPDCG